MVAISEKCPFSLNIPHLGITPGATRGKQLRSPAMPPSDLKRRLWMRFSISLFVGCLACGLILGVTGNWGIAFLLVVGVWAFCRAALVTVRLSENSANGNPVASWLLTSVPRIVGGAPLETVKPLQVHVGDLPGCHEDSRNENRAGAFYILLLELFCFAAFSCLVAPSFYADFLRTLLRGAQQDYVLAAWMSWLVACTAICILFGALLNQPLKYRLPLSSATLFALTMALLLGIKSTDKHFNSSDVWQILAFSIAAYFLGFAVLCLYRWKSSWSLVMSLQADENSPEAQSAVQTQVSITYLMATTTGTAIAIALVKLLFPGGLNLPRGNEFFPYMLIIMLIGTAMLMALARISISLLHVLLPGSTQRRGRHLAWIAGFATIIPYSLMVGISWLDTPQRYPSQVDFTSMYVFFVSYIAISGLLIRILATAGLRLQRAPFEDESNSLPIRKNDG